MSNRRVYDSVQAEDLGPGDLFVYNDTVYHVDSDPYPTESDEEVYVDVSDWEFEESDTLRLGWDTPVDLVVIDD